MHVFSNKVWQALLPEAQKRRTMNDCPICNQPARPHGQQQWCCDQCAGPRWQDFTEGAGDLFLGRYQDYDLYYHEPDRTETRFYEISITLIADYGENYSSGLCFGWLPDHEDAPLVVARKRAQALGLNVLAEHYQKHPMVFDKRLGMWYEAGTDAEKTAEELLRLNMEQE